MGQMQLNFNRVLLIFSYLQLLWLSSCSNNNSPTESNGDPEQQNSAPTAEFSVSALSGDAPLTVSFDASASSDQDGQIVEYDWNYGDGSTHGGGKTSQHTYTQEGNYTATLTVTDDDDLTASKSAQITVTTPPGPTLFPMYSGAQWAYSAEVYFKSLTENTGATEYGNFTATVTEYDEDNLLAKLKMAGDLSYFTENYIPITIPEIVYIRETTYGLERAESAEGPWERTIQTNGSSWFNGGLIFAGSTSRSFSLTQSSVSVPAGVFNGLLVRAHEDNWGEQYAADDHEYSWREFFNTQIGLVWSKYYIYYDDNYDMYGPTITSKELSLTGYAVPLPDGTVRSGGTGATVQVIVNCSPGIIFGSGTAPVVNDRYAPIELNFNMDMNRSSVEGAFSVGLSNRTNLPPLSYTHQGTLDWDGERHMIWTPTDQYEYAPLQPTNVYIRLKKEAQSLSGKQLAETLIFIFSVK